MTRTVALHTLLLLTVMLAAALALGERNARAATTLTYVGPNGGFWAVGANWSPAQVPVDGDTVVFPAAAQGFTTNNNLIDLQLEDLRLDGTNADVPEGAVTIEGFSLTVTDEISVTEGAFYFANGMFLTGDVDIDLSEAIIIFGYIIGAGTGQATTINGTLDIDGENTSYVYFYGPVNGAGRITTGDVAEGPGVSLEHPMDFDGSLDILGGTFWMTIRLLNMDGSHTDCGGAPNLDVTVAELAQLTIDCDAEIRSIDASGFVTLAAASEEHSIYGSLRITGTGASTISGSVRADDVNRVLTCCTSPGTLEITRSQANFNGLLDIDEAAVTLDGNLAASANTGVRGGTLLGTGNARETEASGATIMPGGEEVRGQLSFQGLILTASTLVIDVEQAATDRVRVFGPLTIEDSDLQLNSIWEAPPEIGASFTIALEIEDLTGTFNDLPEGAEFEALGLLWSITYEGGESGSDIVITRLDESPEPETFQLFLPLVASDGAP